MKRRLLNESPDDRQLLNEPGAEDADLDVYDGGAGEDGAEPTEFNLEPDGDEGLGDDEGVIDSGSGDLGSIVSQLQDLVSQLQGLSGEGAEDVLGDEELPGDAEDATDTDLDPAAPTPDLPREGTENEAPVIKEGEAKKAPPFNMIPGQKDASSASAFTKPTTANVPSAAKLPSQKPSGKEGVASVQAALDLITRAAHAIASKASLPAGKGGKGVTTDATAGSTIELTYNKPFKKKEMSEKFKPSINAAVLFEGADLSDDFKAKATKMIEEATARSVEKAMDYIDSTYLPGIRNEFVAREKNLIEKVDEYLDYAVEQYFEDNKLAIEEGISTEINESFMKGLKNLFETHYVEMPAGKENLVEKLHRSLKESEERAERIRVKAIGFRKEAAELRREAMLREASDGLSVLETSKLKKLVENVKYETPEQFGSVLSEAKKTHFTTHVAQHEFETLTEQAPAQENTRMDAYLGAIKRTAQKSGKR